LDARSTDITDDLSLEGKTIRRLGDEVRR